LIEEGRYRYEILRGGETVAVEEAELRAGELVCVRRSVDAMSRYEVRASLDAEGRIVRLLARYSRGPFSRSATYEVGGDFLRGSVSAMGARTVETAKLGRFREIDAGMVVFKALIISHVRQRGQARWTGRVAVIDPNTLTPASIKQTYRQKDDSGLLWTYEPRMGDSEEIRLDETGRLASLADNRGTVARLVGAAQE
jgi:hypothetical protein